MVVLALVAAGYFGKPYIDDTIDRVKNIFKE